MKISLVNSPRVFLVAILSAFSVFALSIVENACAAAPPPVARLRDFTELVEKTGPAVVNIRTKEKPVSQDASAGEVMELNEFLHRFFGVPLPESQSDGQPGDKTDPKQREEIRRGVGSGFIISADGYILTNAHVIDSADEVYVRLTDKREFKARIIGVDKPTDVGLLKIEGANLPRLNLGSSRDIRAGEWVMAIGSPFDLDNTVTAGIISAKARDTGDYLQLIQTDVAVNPGNSGGPLINMRGEAIGITSQIYSRSGGYMGISFAIPIDEAIQVSEQLKAAGKVTRGRIGVRIGEVPDEAVPLLRLPKKQGAMVQSVEPGSPGEKGGLQPGDIILKFNGIPIEKFSELPRQVGNSRPGTKIRFSVWRKGVSREVSITVAELEPEKIDKDRKAEKEKSKKTEKSAGRMLGLVVSDLTDAQKAQLLIDGGVYVAAVDGAALRAGLRPGDVILRINNSDVKNARQFNLLVTQLDEKKSVLFLVRRNGNSRFLTIRPNGT